jgi:G:T/U-mismatch repair DNA glycosylase
VCFNGKTSRKLAPEFATLVLSSSSPANAQLSFGKKLAVRRRILG